MTSKDLYNEVKEIMSHNFSDFCAEEYDERYNGRKYNEAVRKFNEYKENGFDVLPCEINDFSEMVAYLVVFENAHESLFEFCREREAEAEYFKQFGFR